MTWVVYLRQSSPEPSALIGASPGTSAWLVTLAPRPLPRSLSPFMVFLRPLLTSMALASSRQKRGAQTPLNPSSSPIQFDLAGFLSYFCSIYHSFPLHFPSFFNPLSRSLLAACCLLVSHHVGSVIPIRFVALVAVVALCYPLHQREKCVRDGSSSRIGRVRMHSYPILSPRDKSFSRRNL